MMFTYHAIGTDARVPAIGCQGIPAEFGRAKARCVVATDNPHDSQPASREQLLGMAREMQSAAEQHGLTLRLLGSLGVRVSFLNSF